MEVTPRIELGNRGFADLGLTAWLCHQYVIYEKKDGHLKKIEEKTGIKGGRQVAQREANARKAELEAQANKSN